MELLKADRNFAFVSLALAGAQTFLVCRIGEILEKKYSYVFQAIPEFEYLKYTIYALLALLVLNWIFLTFRNRK